MSGILDDADVDVATLEGIYTCTSIDRILVLKDLNDLVLLVRAIAVASQVVHI